MNSEPSNVVKFYNGEQIPLELHKVRVVQKLHLVPVERRLEAAREAGFNTFQLSTNDADGFRRQRHERQSDRRHVPGG